MKRLHRLTLAPRLLCGALAAALASFGAQAEDIDIFASTAEQHVPNVLIIIDNSSNWASTQAPTAACIAAGYSGTTVFNSEMCALDSVVAGLSGSMRVGLMMFSETPGNGGAYVRFAIRNMTDANKTAFRAMLKGMVPNGTGSDASASSQPYAYTMYEAFKYFGGYTNQAQAAGADLPGSPVNSVFNSIGFGPVSYVGGNSNAGAYRRDYPNNNKATNRAAAFYNADSNYAYASGNSDTYVSPIIDPCAKNFIVFISNGNPSAKGADASFDPAVMTALGVTPTALPSATNETHASKMDEMAKFLYETDVSPLSGIQNVQTFTVAVWAPQANGQPKTSDQAMISLMQSAATYGGGQFCSANSADAVAKCIASAFNELQAVNSVFVSSSLPVSVNAQGTFLNQVYMGMFRPDANQSPRWAGNLKEYKVNRDANGGLFLADVNDIPAVNPTTGFISPNAVSFWTAGSNFWVNNPMGTPKTVSDSPDGEVVEKGGAGQQVRTAYASDQTTRKMFTCDPASGCTPGSALTLAFNSTNMSASYASFGVASAAEADKLVRWIRGQDDASGDPCAVGAAACTTWASAEKGPGWPTTIRPSVHGDVLHSRPVVLDYVSQGPYIFYAANDGVLRAIKGGRLGTDGKETWSFVAPEFFSKFKRMRDQTPLIALPSTPGAATNKDYFFDGPIGSYQDTSKAYIFVSARRGGRFIYAFDVTNPANPIFMWKKSNADTGMSELGQTWSEPKAVKVQASTDPVLIFGAGYDPAEDYSPAAANTMGRGVFVLNARTGALIKFFQTASNGSGTIGKPVASDVTVMDRDGDTFADRVYVGDVGGNVWRMDIDDPNPNKWTLEKFATLGSGLKFMYPPDVIATKNFDMVLIGTGDREKPLVKTTTDYFFGLKDTAVGKDGTALTALQLADLTVNGTVTDPTKGFYLTLLPGEKVVNAPLTVSGIVYFATNQPDNTALNPNSCAVNLGTARAYGLDFLGGGAGIDRNGDGTKNASDMARVVPGGGLPPSAVGGTLQLDDGSTVGFCIGCGGGKGPPDAERPPGNIPKIRKKIYWTTDTDK